jgi:hypothetical protein
MCLICVDFQRQKLTGFEARRALGEMREKIGEEHAKEVDEMLVKAACAVQNPATEEPTEGS